MDLFALILACSVAGPQTNQVVHQIAQSVDVSVLYIEDLSTQRAYEAPSKEVAVGLLQTLLDEGHDVRAGLGQINARRARVDFGLSAEQMLDPCTNITVATDQLAQARGRYTSSRRALAFYRVGDSKSSAGLMWADFILMQDAINVSDAAFDTSGKHTSRRFDVTPRMFVDDKARVTTTRASKTLFVKSPLKSNTSSTKATTSESETRPNIEAETNQQTSPESDTNLSTVRSKTKPKAQPNVTEEKLKTTKELEAEK